MDNLKQIHMHKMIALTSKKVEVLEIYKVKTTPLEKVGMHMKMACCSKALRTPTMRR